MNTQTEVMALHCMKCGRKTEDRVFCPDCLSEMEKYPVRPGTVVKLPRRTATPTTKKRHLRHRPFRRPSDQIELLRVRSRWLLFALIVTFVCFLVAIAILIVLLEWHNYIDLSWLGLSARNVSRETIPFASIF